MMARNTNISPKLILVALILMILTSVFVFFETTCYPKLIVVSFLVLCGAVFNHVM